MSDEQTVDTTEEKKYNFPTETIELPSKGLLYPKDNPLSSGKIEMKYMTAKEEDILTNQNYIKKGVVHRSQRCNLYHTQKHMLLSKF